MGMKLHVEKTSASLDLGPVERGQTSRFNRWASDQGAKLNAALEPTVHQSVTHDGVASFGVPSFLESQRATVMAALMATMLQAEELFDWGGGR